jgi:hypothetical protein
MRVLLIAALAAMSTSPSTTTAQEPKKPDVAALVKDLTSPGDKKARAAMDELEKIGLPAFDPLADAFLKTDEKDDRRAGAIVEAMGRLRYVAIKQGDPVAADAIEKVLLDALRDRREYVINRAAFVLTEAEPRCKKAVPDFIAILRDEKKGYYAWDGAYGGLSRLGPDAAAAVPVVLELLADKNPTKKYPKEKRSWYAADRGALCWVLAKIGPKDERVAAALRKTLQDRGDEFEARSMAANSLIRLGPPGQSALAEIVDLVNDLRKARRLGGRAALLESIGELKLGKKELALLLEVAADRHEMDYARECAVKGLAKTRPGEPSSWVALLEVLQNDDDWAARHQSLFLTIVRALGQIEPPKNDRAALLKSAKATFEAILHQVRNDTQRSEMRAEVELTLKKFQMP